MESGTRSIGHDAKTKNIAEMAIEMRGSKNIATRPPMSGLIALATFSVIFMAATWLPAFSTLFTREKLTK